MMGTSRPGAALKNPYLLALLAIIVTASFIRLYNITSRGLMVYDEAPYLREARFFYSISRNLGDFISLVSDKSVSTADLKKKIEGVPPATNPKPLHALLLGGFSILFGLHDYTGGLYSTFFSIIQFLILYKLASMILDRKMALFCCLLLAFSVYHINYSRSSFVEIDSGAFLLASVLLFVRSAREDLSGWKPYFFTGLLFAMAVACNYRILWLGGVFVLFYPLVTVKGSLRRAGLFLLGLLLCLSLFELPYRLVMIFRPLPDGFYTYFQMLFKWYFKRFNPAAFAEQTHSSTFSPHTMLFYFLVAGEGKIFSLLVAVGGIAGLYLFRRNREILFVYAITLLPFLMFSMTLRGNRPVAFSSSLPFLGIVALGGCSRLMDSLPLSIRWKTLTRFIPPLLVIICILSSLPQVWQEINLRSGYRAACDFLSSRGGEHHFTTNNAIARFYLGRNSAEWPPVNKSAYLSNKSFRTTRFFVRDFFYVSYPGNDSRRKVADFLMKNGRKTAVFSNDWVTQSVAGFDQFNDFFRNIPLSRFRSLEGMDTIVIYEFPPGILDDYFGIED